MLRWRVDASDLAYYDLEGEGVAYHDTDPQNHGSGELNPADVTYLNEFRIHEGVDRWPILAPATSASSLINWAASEVKFRLPP
jgi:hypothetical protein